MTHKIIKNIACFVSIVCIIFNVRPLHTASFIYVSDESNVAVLDSATNSIVTSITVPPLSIDFSPIPSCIAVAPNGTTACVGVYQEDSTNSTDASTIGIINTSLSVPILTNTATLIASSPNTIRTTCVAYTTDSNAVYVGVNTGTSPSVIFSVTNVMGSPTVDTAIPIPDATSVPTDIAIANTSNGETAYIVTNAADIYYMYIPGNIPIAIDTTGITADSLSGIVIAPGDKTAYALGTDYSNILIYSIDTSSNTVTNLLSPILIPGEGGPSGITTDGTYLYVTGASNRNLYIIPINNPEMASTIPLAGQPNCLSISPDGSTVYIGYKNGGVVSYFVPSGSPADLTQSIGSSIYNNSIATLPLIFPPASISGCKTQNMFLLQTDFINNITWTAPTTGNPAAYAMYRDPALTQLVSIIPANSPLQYYDHGRNPSMTYSYYIVSVDTSGNQSAVASVTVTNHC